MPLHLGLLDIFAPKKPAMVPLWTLIPTALVSALVYRYAGRTMDAIERGAIRAARALRKAAKEARQGKYIKTKE